MGVVGADDIKIIYNDWPYGIDRSIVHLCVWTKFPLDVDEKDPNGDLTPEMREKIDAYVEKTFGSRVPAENVRSPLYWFFSHNLEFSDCLEDYMVQELGEAEVHSFHGAFSCHDEGSRYGVYQGDYEGR